MLNQGVVNSLTYIDHPVMIKGKAISSGVAIATGGTGQAPSGQGGVGQSAGGFGHPKCLNNPSDAAVAGLPPVK